MIKDIIITIKAYKRPYYLKKVINSLEDQKGIDKYNILVSLDSDEETEKESIGIIEKSKLFNQIELIVHSPKLGCAGNMKYCFDYAFELNKYESMVHLEDDTIVGGDFIHWMSWYLKYMRDYENIFAVCPFRSKINGGSDGMLEESFLSEHFECMGGFGILKSQWKHIQELGGLFGVLGCASKISAPPEIWKKFQNISWFGSWAWPINRFFMRGKVCLIPSVSRSNNIGSREGIFNPSEKWHAENIFDQNWIESDKYKNTLNSHKIIYQNPKPVNNCESIFPF